MSKSKYETYLYTGIIVEQNPSGRYVPKKGAKPNVWRTGKHTKGKYVSFGQVFLTENNQTIAVINVENLPFNQRHAYTPMQRWTSETVDNDLLLPYKKA